MILDFSKAFAVQSDYLDGDYDEVVRAELEAQAQQAVREERERCAKALESHEAMTVAIAALDQYPDGRGRLCTDLANFVRAR